MDCRPPRPPKGGRNARPRYPVSKFLAVSPRGRPNRADPALGIGGSCPGTKDLSVQAAALILNYLRGAWDSRFAQSGCAFDDQEIIITVPASFDAAAQRLTLNAAEEAGFPSSVQLLEEPQAVFYCWLERHSSAEPLWAGDAHNAEPRHALIVDVGGGTSDFSLFALRSGPVGRPSPTSRGSLSANTFCWVATTSTWPSRSYLNRDGRGNAARFPGHNGSILSRHVAI